MYIKLIQPKMRKRPVDTRLKLHMAPPLGLLTIVSLLGKNNRISLENENIQSIDYADHPDIVGISVNVDTLPRAISIAEKFRERGIVVVAGGIHITTAYETIPKDAFDVLCIGAAEGTWPRIIEDFEKGALKTSYKCHKDFSGKDIVSPAYDFLTKDKYLYCNVIHTSRGCPFRCDFCYNSADERMYVNRDIEAVLRDIKAVKSKHILFIDDNLAGNPRWLREFLNRLIPLRVKWNAAVSLNALCDAGLLDLMKRSGCQGLFVGFESIRADSIAAVHKVQNDRSIYEKAVKMAHDRGIMINASFVFGLDGDTPATFKATLDWIVKNRIETVTSHILTPYPGTELYNRFKKEGRILSDDLSKYNTAHVVFRPEQMSEKELYDGYLWIYKQVYSLKNIIKRMPKAKSQRIAYLLFNLFYRKYGRFTDLMCGIITYKNVGRIAEKMSRYL